MFYRNVSNSICKLRKFVYQSLIQNSKYKNPIFCKSFHSSTKYLFQIKNTRYNFILNIYIKSTSFQIILL